MESRNDILKFTTDVLTQDVVMKGEAKVHLTVSSDKKDTDFAIRLTDVYPDGRSMLVNDGIFRMRFRNGYTAADTAVMVPGNTYTCDIMVPASCITFKAGHRIRVDVTSSNYPRFNRNANNGGVMYPGNNGDSLTNPAIAGNVIFMDDVTRHSYISRPLTASPVLAIADVEGDDMQAELFPNPTTGKFEVVIASAAKQSHFIIYNAIGDKVSEFQSPSDHKSFAIDLSDQPKEVYFLHVKTEVRGVVKKIIRF